MNYDGCKSTINKNKIYESDKNIIVKRNYEKFSSSLTTLNKKNSHGKNASRKESPQKNDE
jgi:hypothetical protein